LLRAIDERNPRKIEWRRRRAKRRLCAIAPDTLHRAVDGLHPIDFPADKTSAFLLTLKMKGVKTNSFFDSF
jgi:hypothetical protein